MNKRRFNKSNRENKYSYPDVDHFIEEIIEICKKYDYSISHEDEHGKFIIEYFNENNAKWLRDANVNFGFGDNDDN